MLPKRAVVAIVTTVIALALLLSFRTPDQVGAGAVALRGGTAVADPPSAVSTPGAAASQAPFQPLPADPGVGVPAQPDPTAAPRDRGRLAPPGFHAPGTTPAPTAAPTGRGGSASGQVTGPTVSTPYGDVQVQIAVSGGRLTDVVALQLPSDRRRSAELSQYAEPILRSEALQAQSANIDAVSGATFTSMGYAQSLQAAIDQAGI